MSRGEHRDGGIAHQVATTSVDPVCRMEVEPSTAAGGSADHGGTTYWFCNPGCRDKFAADPTRYAGGAPAARTPTAVDGRIYTCPMHPEVRHRGPGVCPECGMALEPETVTHEEAPSPELVDMTRRFWGLARAERHTG